MGIGKIEIAGISLLSSDNVFEPYYSAEDDELHELFELLGKKNVLDVGTGTGILPLIWERKFHNLEEIWGIDINHDAVNLAKENTASSPKIHIQESDLFEYFDNNCSEKKFDAIIFNGPHVHEEAHKYKEKFGPLFCALCDPDLTTAERFFRNAKRYLSKDGFIIYTFSDYGNLERLLATIKDADSDWSVTIQSIGVFHDKYLEEHPTYKKTVPLWYNLKIKRCDELETEDMIKGYRKATLKLADFYSDFAVDKSIYDEYLHKIELILNGMFIQVGQRLPTCDDWMTSGFSLPSWGGKEIHWDFLHAFGQAIGQEAKEKYADLLKAFTEALKETLNGKIKFIVDNLAGSSWDFLQAKRSDEFQRVFFPVSRKTTYSVSFAPSETELRIGADTSRTDLKAMLIKYVDEVLAKDREITMLEDEERKVFYNLCLNFYALSTKNKFLSNIHFKKVAYTAAEQKKGSVYFFCSFNHLEDRKAHELVSSLEEVISLANNSLQSPIWSEVRNTYALSSAVAAIMARNMSHLLGSHIEPGIQNDMPSFLRTIIDSLKEVDADFNDEMLMKLKDWVDRPGAVYRGLAEEMDNRAKDYMVSILQAKDKALGRYSMHRQRRMDFIARVATNWPKWGIGLDFYNHFVLPIMSNSLFLHFLGYSNEITIDHVGFRVRAKGRDVQEVIPDGSKPLRVADLAAIFGIDGKKPGDPFRARCTENFEPMMMWSRGGDMATQAFHVILENVMRNTVKHSPLLRTKEQDLILGVFIYDDLEDLEGAFNACGDLRLKDHDCFYVVICSVADVDNEQKVCNLQDKKLKSPIIKMWGERDPEDWGMKEMKIASAFLANKEIDQCMSTSPDFIQAGTIKWDNGGHQVLAYCIALPRFHYLGVLN